MVTKTKAWRSTMLVLAAALVTLTACQSSSGKYTGSGPLWVSPRIAVAFDEYRSRFNPEYFAISTDGRCAAWVYFEGASHASATAHKTVNNCETNCKRPCKILARHSDVVWDGPIEGLAPPKEP